MGRRCRAARTNGGAGRDRVSDQAGHRPGSDPHDVAADLARGVVLADAAYGMNTDFRDGLTALGLQYVVGVQSSMTVWEPGQQPLPAKPRGKIGRPPRLWQRSIGHQPVSVKQLAMSLPSTAFQEITWRE